MPTPNITTISRGASSVPTENPNHWAKKAVRDWAIWCTRPTTSRGRKAMITLRNTSASRIRISRTVAIEMIFSARLNSLA